MEVLSYLDCSADLIVAVWDLGGARWLMVEGGLSTYYPGHSRSFWNVPGKMEKEAAFLP